MTLECINIRHFNVNTEANVIAEHFLSENRSGKAGEEEPGPPEEERREGEGGEDEEEVGLNLAKIMKLV